MANRPAYPGPAKNRPARYREPPRPMLRLILALLPGAALVLLGRLEKH